MFSAPVTGGSAAVPAPREVAAGVGHPVTKAAGPEPSIQADPFTPAMGEKFSAGFGTAWADQIQMPASGSPTVQREICCWPVCPSLSLSGVHSRGRFRPQASSTSPPPEKRERLPHLGEADGLLVYLHQGPDIPDLDGEHLLSHRPLMLSKASLSKQAGEIQRHPQKSSHGYSATAFLVGLGPARS